MFVYANICITETLVSVILKKINIIYLFLFICVVANFPIGYSSSSSNISDYVKIIETTWTQHYIKIT